MWNRIKSWFGSPNDPATGAPQYEAAHDFKWYEPGDGNPFGIRVLDVRSLTWNLVSTTSDPKVAESFVVLRNSDGRDLVTKSIKDSIAADCDLHIPHDGSSIEGIVYKAESMDEKWDIYAYDSTFLFARSWTGDLHYRAYVTVGDRSIHIRAIETTPENSEIAPQAVYFILGTHAMRRVLPHTIPRFFPGDPKQIAALSFSMYGKFACYATYEDVTQVPITTREDRP